MAEERRYSNPIAKNLRGFNKASVIPNGRKGDLYDNRQELQDELLENELNEGWVEEEDE